MQDPLEFSGAESLHGLGDRSLHVKGLRRVLVTVVDVLGKLLHGPKRNLVLHLGELLRPHARDHDRLQTSGHILGEYECVSTKEVEEVVLLGTRKDGCPYILRG